MNCRLTKHAGLSALCEGVRASVGAARDIVLHGAVCEVMTTLLTAQSHVRRVAKESRPAWLACQEEDFVAHTFGLPLQPGTTKQDAAQPVAALTSAEEELLEARRQSHKQASACPDDGSFSEPILQRLRFAKALLVVRRSLACMSRKPLRSRHAAAPVLP